MRRHSYDYVKWNLLNVMWILTQERILLPLSVYSVDSQRTWNPTESQKVKLRLNTLYSLIFIQQMHNLNPNITNQFDVINRTNKMLTIRKQAPRSTAFIFTSRSRGNLIPKLSASVKASWTKPVHCLLMQPTAADSSIDKIWSKKGKNGIVHHVSWFFFFCPPHLTCQTSS